MQYYAKYSTAHPDDFSVYSDYLRGAETFVYSQSFGAQVDWNFSEKWMLSGAILYNSVGEKTKVIEAEPVIAYMFDEQFIFEMQYLECAINMNRKLGKYFIVEFGLSPSKTIRAKVERYQVATNFWSATLDKESLKYMLFGNLGFGFNYSFTPLTLKILPYAQLQLYNGHDPYVFGRIFPYMQYLSVGVKTSVLF
ncbi:MAG: hypothetical protein IPO32_02850 [Crocinitomicaceae bacterium]|nr:hypothetical protein [Crocinitomicaceae bacterium]